MISASSFETPKRKSFNDARVIERLNAEQKQMQHNAILLLFQTLGSPPEEDWHGQFLVTDIMNRLSIPPNTRTHVKSILFEHVAHDTGQKKKLKNHDGPVPIIDKKDLSTNSDATFLLNLLETNISHTDVTFFFNQRREEQGLPIVCRSTINRFTHDNPMIDTSPRGTKVFINIVLFIEYYYVNILYILYSNQDRVMPHLNGLQQGLFSHSKCYRQ
jgi:hypothetical protein